ncbi:MAG: ABC transporter ATP-binding protein [Nitrososphaerales archaeon]
MPDLLNISKLSVEYFTGRNAKITAVDNTDLVIPSTGYTLGLVGESGSGKTTLGTSIMNLIEFPGRITNGSVNFLGNNILEMSSEELRKFRWQEISMVYQSAMNSLNPVKDVSWHIVEVLRQHKKISNSEAMEQTIRLLTEVGIKPDRVKDFPHEFSGGMRQRVVIAMALALSPKLLIADEPTSALDVVVQRQILSLLKREVINRGLSLILITHEIAILKGLVENVAVMFSGEIAERGPTDKVLFEPLHPYTEMLIGSLLTMDSGEEMIRDIPIGRETGDVTPKVGCKYANRCKYVFDRCRTERPHLLEAEPGRYVACHKYH